MKTWEMIKELQEDPKAKFKNLRNDLIVFVNDNGELSWDSIGNNESKVVFTFPGFSSKCGGNINDEWIMIKPKVTDFMGAVNSSKRFRPKGLKEYRNLNQILDMLCIAESSVAREYINGDWEIEP
jgi:hypothetical protein